jgi:PTH1 family peptidyl-tRNA hydrolase
MKLIIGLGNPGEKYKNTRHNAGFMFVDKLAQSPEIVPVNESLVFNLNKKLKSRIADTVKRGEKIILVKPETFMNVSGIAVSSVMSYFKAEISDIVVVYDDIDLLLGEARFRDKGSSAGHKGVQNIIDQLGTSEFARIRIGIRGELFESEAMPSLANGIDTSSYVLENFTDREMPILHKVISKSSEKLIEYFGKKESLSAGIVKLNN